LNLSNSLPRNFSISHPTGSLSSDGFQQSSGGGNLKKKWGKNTNLTGLYAGLRQLRCLLELLSPGILPDETIVGTILNLVKIKYIFFTRNCSIRNSAEIFQKIRNIIC